MLRAVEVMAQFIERQMKPNAPSPPLDRPVFLFHESLAVEVGKTTRQNVEYALGSGFSYPAPGWHTYALRHEAGPALLSIFYKDDVTIGAEFYLAKTKSAPPLAPRDFGAFRLVPGEVGLGSPFGLLSKDYSAAIGGPGTHVYSTAYEARFPGGIAYVMGNKGRVERLVVYADR